MVIYGSIMGVSIGGLFAAGILPGLLICLVCMAIIAGLARRHNLPKADNAPSLMDIFRAFRSSLVALIMPIIILGGILGAVVTPTEAASVAVAYALFVGVVIYRAITIEDFIQMLIRTARVTGVIFLIIASASILGWWLAFEQIPQAIASGFLGISDNPNVIIALILVLLLAVGMLMDITAILIILAPVLAPLTLAIGMDPVHAGIVFVLALNISLMTPPVGACLFVLSLGDRRAHREDRRRALAVSFGRSRDPDPDRLLAGARLVPAATVRPLIFLNLPEPSQEGQQPGRQR